MSQGEEDQRLARFQWEPGDIEFVEEGKPEPQPITVEELRQRTEQMTPEEKARLLAEAGREPGQQEGQ